MKATSTKRSPLGVVLSLAFVIAMLMSVGPGVLLVNRPEAFLGLPILYAWAIFWYFVLVAIALLAFFFVWRDKPDNKSKRAS